MQANDFATAERILNAMLAAGGETADIYRLLAMVESRRGDLDLAMIHAQRAVGLDAENTLAWNTLGTILHARGDGRSACEAFGAACRLSPKSLELWAHWGKTLVEHQQFAEAISVLDRALALGEHGASRKRLAVALAATGQLELAQHHYRSHLERHAADGAAWFALASLGENVLTHDDGELLRALASDSQTPDDDRIGIRFALAREAEQRSDYNAAFEYLSTANAAERRRIVWNQTGFDQHVADILFAFDSASAPRQTRLGHGVIFVLGLPRTGSTLIEQIITQEAGAKAGGELSFLPELIHAESQRRGKPLHEWAGEATPRDWEALGERYLARIAQLRDGAAVFTDKRCGNWLFVGVIARILPGARIVYTRRDPVDTCFGCFRQYFSHGAQLFSYDLRECAAYWRECERAMRIWQQRHAEQIWFQQHETLVSQHAEEARALREFCGLPEHETPSQFPRATIATASAAQLRSIRTVPRSWSEQYGSHLDPVRAALRKCVLK